MPNIPLGEWSGSDATKALHETIRQYQEESNKLKSDEFSSAFLMPFSFEGGRRPTVL
jgi:hypothetical protein